MLNDVTEILLRIDEGDRSAIDELLPEVYDALRRIAQERMNAERRDHTLQATALVNEAYLRLVNPKSPLKWESRGQFFAAAAEAMRRILVEHARARLRQKRGGDFDRAELPGEIADYRLSPQQMLEFDEALDLLAQKNAVRAEVVKLRCFAGLDREQLSNTLGVSLATIDRHWAVAKVWLYQQLHAGEATDPALNANPSGSDGSRHG